MRIGSINAAATALFEGTTIRTIMPGISLLTPEGIEFRFGLQFGFLPVLVASGRHSVLPRLVAVPCMVVPGYYHIWERCLPNGRHYHMV